MDEYANWTLKNVLDDLQHGNSDLQKTGACGSDGIGSSTSVMSPKSVMIV